MKPNGRRGAGPCGGGTERDGRTWRRSEPGDGKTIGGSEKEKGLAAVAVAAYSVRRGWKRRVRRARQRRNATAPGLEREEAARTDFTGALLPITTLALGQSRANRGAASTSPFLTRSARRDSGQKASRSRVHVRTGVKSSRWRTPPRRSIPRQLERRQSKESRRRRRSAEPSRIESSRVEIGAAPLLRVRDSREPLSLKHGSVRQVSELGNRPSMRDSIGAGSTS